MPIYVPSSGYSGDPTLSELVDRVNNSLPGYGRNQEQATHLLTGIDDDDLTISVNNAANVSVGLIEIEDELLWVDSVDTTAGTATIAPYGRGYATSVLDSHSALVKVLNNPLFPRKRTADAINDVIYSLSNQLYAVAYTDITFTPMKASYTLPDGIQDILGVVQRSLGPSETWEPVVHYRYNQFAAAGTETGTGGSIELRQVLYAGMPVRVTYTTDPVPFSQMSDTLSLTGLAASARDVLVYGACWRLASFLDSTRIDLSSAMADNQDTSIPPGSGAALSKYFYTLYAQRLQEERSRMQALYDSQIIYTQS